MVPRFDRVGACVSVCPIPVQREPPRRRRTVGSRRIHLAQALVDRLPRAQRERRGDPGRGARGPPRGAGSSSRHPARLDRPSSRLTRGLFHPELVEQHAPLGVVLEVADALGHEADALEVVRGDDRREPKDLALRLLPQRRRFGRVARLGRDWTRDLGSSTLGKYGSRSAMVFWRARKVFQNGDYLPPVGAHCRRDPYRDRHSGPRPDEVLRTLDVGAPARGVGTDPAIGRKERARGPSSQPTTASFSERRGDDHPVDLSALDPLNRALEARLELDHPGDVNVLAHLGEVVHRGARATP
jgi:hypothetical protein